MPVDYNEQTKRFERDGVEITPAELSLLITKLTDTTKRQAKLLSQKLERGDMTLAEWTAAMATLLTSAHIVAATVGRGGRKRMTDADWRKVRSKAEWQQGFLPRFGRAIVAGVVAGAALLNRARMYGDPPFVSFSSAYKESQGESSGGKEILVARELNAKESCDDCEALAALGYIPLDEMPEIGEDTSCGDFCKCFLIFTDV